MVLDAQVEEVLSVMDPYDSFEDWPYPLIYREIFQRYGQSSKFVLTVRESPAVWLESLKRHSLTTHPTKHCRRMAYGYDFPHGYEEEHIAFYERHNREVKEFFAENAPNSLIELCWERGDGWKELCDFIEQPIPNIDFPKTNSSVERAENTSNTRKLENLDLIEKQMKSIQANRA